MRDTLIGVVAFCALGAAVEWAFVRARVSFSAAVAALIVALVLLALRRRIDAPVASGAAVLLRWFPLFFVPACAGIVDLRAILQPVWFAAVLVLVVSTVLGIVAGIVCGRLLERGGAST